jgi:GDP-4-dehydro-6-deoxy-D-mannose reductase
MRRILVTGASGFLAGHLIARLEGRRPVIKIGRERDLADPGQARAAVRAARPDEVYHLAGTTRAKDWDGMWRAHVTATVNILQALADAGRPVRVIIAASSAEYGAAGGVRRAKEDAPLEPVNLYGACKVAQTMAALSFNRGALEIVVARIFNVLGPGTPENLAPGAFATQIDRVAAGLQSREILVGELSPRRDYIDARDVATALEILMRRGVPGEIYNVGSGRSSTMRAVLQGLAGAAGVRIVEKVDPSRCRPSEVRDIAADTRKLAALGWKPRIPLARSLADMLER